MISRPAQSASYPGRQDQCVSAIETRFNELIETATGSFIDREAISATLLTEATRSGWAQHEIEDAIRTLAKRGGLSAIDRES